MYLFVPGGQSVLLLGIMVHGGFSILSRLDNVKSWEIKHEFKMNLGTKEKKRMGSKL